MNFEALPKKEEEGSRISLEGPKEVTEEAIQHFMEKGMTREEAEVAARQAIRKGMKEGV